MAVAMTADAACRRTATRVRVARPSTLRADERGPLDVTVEDLSPAGFSFSFSGDTPIAIGSLVHVGLAGAGRASARVAWHDGDRHGCLFAPSLTADQVDAAFTHSVDVPAVTSFVMADEAAPAAPAAPARLAPAARVALLLAGGGLGWVAIAATLRALPSF